MRTEILNGNLPMVGYKTIEEYPDQESDIVAFWRAIWLNFLNDQTTNGIVWYEKLGRELYNKLTIRLAHNGWIECSALAGRKWIEVELLDNNLFEYVTPDELTQVKARYKYLKYTLEFKDSVVMAKTKQNGAIRNTGLVREGFRDAGNTQFGFDMDALAEYEDAVKANLTKSMDKIREFYPEMKNDETAYDVVSAGIYDYHNNNKYEVFTLGDTFSDSRGRAISDGLKKVFNPISNKDARCALLITYE